MEYNIINWHASELVGIPTITPGPIVSYCCLGIKQTRCWEFGLAMVCEDEEEKGGSYSDEAEAGHCSPHVR